MSAKVCLQDQDYMVVASDGMSQQDSVRIVLRATEQAREFVNLAGTIREPEPQGRRRMYVVKDLERVFFVEHRPGKRKRTRIVRPPGSRLFSLADFFYSPKALERVLQPILADMQAEYFKALAENRRIKAEWIRLRGYVSFWKALGLYTIVKNLVEIWKISGLG